MKEKEINEPNSTDMNRKGIVTAFLLAAGLLAGREAQAQRTYEEMEQLTVNERVTMVVTVSEPVRPADISTDKESLPRERKAYNNSAVSMSTAEMTRYARRIGNSPAKIRNVVVVKKATFPNDKTCCRPIRSTLIHRRRNDDGTRTRSGTDAGCVVRRRG